MDAFDIVVIMDLRPTSSQEEEKSKSDFILGIEQNKSILFLIILKKKKYNHILAIRSILMVVLYRVKIVSL